MKKVYEIPGIEDRPDEEKFRRELREFLEHPEEVFVTSRAEQKDNPRKMTA